MADGNDKIFETWLQKFCDSFVKLTDTQKNCTIERLIPQCGPEQLRLLSTKLEILVKRDFFKSLPLELGVHILKWLDVRSLCICCLVCKTWNKVISSCHDVWHTACERLGFASLQEKEKDIHWKRVYAKGMKRVQGLQDKGAFKVSYLFGHTARVFALSCRGNLMATGSDDRSVRLWDIQSGHCLHVLSTHTCADILFDNAHVLTASFDNTVGLWEWQTGQQLQCYHGHTGAVFCVDWCERLDLIVSGSADTTIKSWGWSSGACLMTRYGHSDWVIKVMLMSSAVNSLTHDKGEVVLLSMDKKSIKVWSLEEAEPCATLFSNDDNISLHPRLQFDGRFITCASEAGIHLWNFENLQLVRLFEDSPAKWLVEYGELFTLLLDASNLHITRTQSQRTITSFPLPPFRRSVRGSNFTSGFSDWLNSLNPVIQDKLVFAASMPDHSILLLKFSEVT
ncbi:F-box/WD repeat-containing protein 2 [Nematostella vectensis]|uniref:F-box/WD repeat-containing protein 2 n=1 Tax=Nematostella vectensis TaxID=45351 RepID=UPI0020774EA6|nr:F-box/WD repeat-containing protein 2 [Nematostella vectensis]